MLGSRASAEPGPWRTSRTPYLKEVMDALSAVHPARRVVFMKGAQVGAPLAIDTPIPTAEGWARMGSLIVGDTLFDERGMPCSVTGVSPVIIGRACYSITFDDGESVVCDGEHRWPVWDFTDGEKPVERVLHTREMVKWVRIGRGPRYRYAIDCCQPVDLPDQDLLIHPYVLGMWLGDGSSTMNHISVHEDDAEVAEHLQACGVEAQFRLPSWRKGRCANIVIDPTFRLVDDGATPASIQHRSRFTTRLRMLDVLDNKHIPAAYLRASRLQRLELIRGMMDSDGTITPDGKRCEFCNGDRRLVDGMLELLRSLGYKPTVYYAALRRRVIDGQDRTCLGYWRVSWTAYAEEPMFRLSRKVARMRSIAHGRPGKSRRRRIVSIEPTNSVPVRCIEVDSPNHLYLCGQGWIPTHNTESGNNWLGYIMHHVPAPALAVQPTVELAKRFSRQRIDPLLEETPALRERVAPARARDSGNTMLSKEFPGGILVLTGANSAVGLRSMTARFLFLDEVDAYPGDVAGEGDPIALAEARARTFGWRRKAFLVSTPTISGRSRIEREYLASDQRRFFVPCPACGEMQWLRFDRLLWEKGAPETARYHCSVCDQPMQEHDKTAMLSAGEWRPTAVGQDPHTVGFHISALYSPVGWLSWAQIARDWEAAQGKPEDIKTFKNTVLGETWQEQGEAPDWERLVERREDFALGVVPAGALVLTAGVDVQDDRIEADIWGWAEGNTSWLVDHLVIPGSPRGPEPWDALAGILARDWPSDGGGSMRVARLCVDTGGRDTAAVYGHLRRLRDPRIAPTKGVDGWNRAQPVHGPTWVDALVNGQKLRRGLKLWTVSVSTWKADLYRRLWLGRGDADEWPPGWVHLPRAIEVEWVKQLVAEQLRTSKDKRGFARQEWAKLRDRNEALDCAVLARAALWLLGADRYGERFWARLRNEVANAPLLASEIPSAGNVARPSPSSQPAPPPEAEAFRPRGWLGSRGGWLR